MMEEHQNQSDSQILAVIHVVLCTAVLYFISTSSGCNDDTSEVEVENLGPQVEQEDIVNAYYEVMESKSPLEIKQGNASLYEANYRLELGSVFKIMDTVYLVENRTYEDNVLTLNLCNQSNFYDEFNNVTETQPKTCNVEKIYIEEKASDLASMSLYQRTRGLLEKQGTLPLAAFSEAPKKITHHNLKVKDYQIKAPSKVAKKTNCLDIPKCKLNIREVSFEIVEWQSETKKKRAKEKWTFTADLPAIPGAIVYGLGGMLSQCLTQVMKFDTDKGKKEALVTSCQNVLRDFQFESPEE